MNEQARRQLLRSFFSAYFHEDWRCEADSTDAVVTGYARTATPGDIRLLGEAILDFSRTFANDKDLEEKLFADLGCYYRPSAQGLSAKIWLEAVASQLLSAIRS